VKQIAILIAIAAIALSAGAIRNASRGGRLASSVHNSVHNFRQNFGELRKVETMNPIERFMFSLALANYYPKA
jgi:hypothetical protein